MASSPAQIGHYELGQPVGEGGQGRTYRAVDRRDGRTVALKVLTLRGEEGWKRFDLFERECRVLRSLDHPGIPRYLDTFADEDEGRYCLVMELVEGTSLRQLLREGEPLPEAQVWSVLHQALNILEYLHGLRPPVIHRDVKPDNLVRRPDGTLALVDFGGVRVALRPEGGSTVVGTFGYMAPEQLHGEALPATDLYGLGSTIAALVTGVEADKLPRQGLRLDLPRVMEPSPLRALIQQLVEPDPANRLRSVADARRAIDELRSPDRRGASADAAADAPQSDADADDELGRLDELDRPLAFITRILGAAGYVGLTILDAVLLPLLFAMLGAVWSKEPDRLAKLESKRRTARRALRSGRRAMGALVRGRDPYRLEGPKPPPRLPPHAPRPRGRGGRRGHRGRGRGRRR